MIETDENPAEMAARLDRAIRRGELDDGYVGLAWKAFEAYHSFAGGMPFPDRPSAEGFFDHLEDGERGIDWLWTAFQHVAAAIWGTAETAHLQAVLRARRCGAGTKRTTEEVKLERALAQLPDVYREPLARALAEKARRLSAPARLVQQEWGHDRRLATVHALARYARWAEANDRPYLPIASADLEAFAKATRARPTVNTDLTVGTYVQMIVRALEGVIAAGEGWDFTGLELVRDGWLAGGTHSNVRNKHVRVVSAFDVYDLGMWLIAQARARPVRNTGAVLAYRDGLLLALAVCVPQRARALECLERDVTLRVHPGADGRPLIVEIDIPAARTKDKRRFYRAFEHAELARCLVEYWRDFRPILDDAGWLWPSARVPGEGIGRQRLSRICRDLTAQHLGRRLNIHLIRDCVVTTWIELDALDGPGKASALLTHKSLAVTRAHYNHADDLIAQDSWDEHRRAIRGRRRASSLSF